VAIALIVGNFAIQSLRKNGIGFELLLYGAIVDNTGDFNAMNGNIKIKICGP
jgi:hypothetical protein